VTAVILRGDAACLPLPDCSVDAVVTDPPYGLAELSAAVVLKAIAAWMAGDRTHVPDGRGFMGREWDRFVPPPGAWDECMRVLKPGGHLLSFAGSRTVDLMTLSIRIAGFEIRDGIDWIYGSGFPKGKACLKPAHEPIVVARKPLAGTVAANVLEHGTGALNIDGCRVACDGKGDFPTTRKSGSVYAQDAYTKEWAGRGEDSRSEGRWPPNVLLTHTADCEPAGNRVIPGNIRLNPTVQAARENVAKGAERERARGTRGVGNPDGTETVEAWDCAPGCPVAGLNAQSAGTRAAKPSKTGSAGNAAGEGVYGGGAGLPRNYTAISRDDAGGASRFFPVLNWSPEYDLPFLYQAKASARERPRLDDGTAWPTVKPVAVMRWLVRLVTPPGGRVLDLFCGTGPTGVACALEGFDAVLLDRDPQAIALTRVRLARPVQPSLFGLIGGDGKAPPGIPIPAGPS
jgi:hypothetical protein